ncbi:alkaline phosphatase PhoX [Salarchaeum sp. JOR-1]|uniref:alkaline phosphatase PhoX n=1 Tax=Salarchaeum sp. JOR-1 TaxID=2599399 RepID=UPI0011988B12|nr:alkaline phosphatase PhoX [Salarchaeum sp. JOR-1]QDX39387.1 DUF839 domain-containing protein [Salarchaeum sp. JOR-1]
MVDLTRRNLIATSVAAAVGAGMSGVASADVTETDTVGAPSVKGEIERFVTTSLGAEVTGPFVFESDNTLLFSHQHPSRDNPEPWARGGIGYVSGFNFTLDGSNDDFEELSVPTTADEQNEVRTSEGEYVFLARQEEPINNGDEQLGVPETPDGDPIDRFAGSRYTEPGYTPDCNQFIPTNEAGTEGYLFTNFETSPGNVSRIPISRTEDGEWEADLDNAINLANTESLRSLGGTRINCGGNRTPYGTYVSSEEEYAMPRTSYGATVSETLKSESGAGLRGAAHFWNRPNPAEISGKDYVTWYPQGAFALTGVELTAYYLGADAVDQDGPGQSGWDVDTPSGIDARANGTSVEVDESNTREPIGEGYPNKYRYGYQVEFREPTAETPTAVKHYAMGRGSWEMPSFQPDNRTVYELSDGDNKGIYKFVADQPLDSYDDPMQVSGTLYVAKVTNAAASAADAGQRRSPANTNLELEWLPLGNATNAEIESWIADYDDVTQVDYLETHADTDWQENLDAAIEEADQEVIANGNQNYISDQEIVEWATQYEQRGPDGVDEELRRVPFLETRAAAKEIGASTDFNKAEGVDSIDGAQPGDFVYMGISEFNDAFADSSGDIQLERVDGGLVYRAELDQDYDISRLEPAIVGPDSTDSSAVSDDALLNVDNVHVMDDGRVLCCEDADQLGRSYPNDCLYVYQPNVLVDVESAAVSLGVTGTVTLYAKSLPTGFSGAQLNVAVSNPDVATVTGVDFNDALGLTESTVTEDGSTASLRFADTERKVQPGGHRVPIAELTLRGDSTGTTDLDISINQMDDETGDPIDAEDGFGVLVVGPPAVAGSGAPTDPDGDGLYEDLNGNGRLDYEDIQILFRNFNADSVTMNEWAYDFNENGQLDYDDIVELFEEVN